jgi:hypothetical protein
VDILDVRLVLAPAADAVIFDPRPAPRDREVHGEVFLGLGVDRDEPLRRVAGLLDDIELVHDDPALDGVAADDRAGRLAGARRRAQDLRLDIRDAVVAGADLDPAGPHAGRFDLALQLAGHPLGEAILRPFVPERRHPRLAIDAGRHDDREPGRLRNRPVEIGAPADADGRAFDQRGVRRAP